MGYFDKLKDKLSGKKQLNDHKSDLVPDLSTLEEQDKPHDSIRKNRIPSLTVDITGEEDEDKAKNDNDPQILLGHSSKEDHEDPQVKLRLSALRKLRGASYASKRDDDEMSVQR